MSDIKVVIGADIKNLQTELAKAGGATQAFANKATAANNMVGGSFTKLSTQSRVASAALSTVGSSLSTLISGGVIAGIALLGVGIFQLSKNLIGLSEAQKLTNDAISSGKDEYVKATLLVDHLKDRVKLARDGVISKEMALKEYNNTMGKTTGAVKTLDEAEQELVNNGPKYIQYTLLKAAAQYTAQKAAEKLFDAELKSAKAQEVNSRIKQDDIGQFIKSGEENIRKQKRLNDQKKVNLLNSIADSFNAQAAEIAKGFKKIEVVTEEEEEKLKKKKVKSIRTISDVLKELDKEIAFLNTRSIILNTDEAKNKLSALNSALNELVKNFGLTAKDPIIIDLVFKIDKIEFQQLSESFKLAEREAIKKVTTERTVGLEKPIIVKPKIKFIEPEIDKEFEAFADKIHAMVEATIENAISGIAESIGEALADGGPVLPRLFDGLISGLGAQLKELGKFLIQTGVIMEAAKKALKALFANPLAQVVVGIGLVALGSLLQAQVRKKAPGLASGTRNFQGGVVDVGERGPERIFLPNGSRVQPNNEVNAFSGGGVVLQPSIHYEGTGFRIMLNRVDAQMGRNG